MPHTNHNETQTTAHACPCQEDARFICEHTTPFMLDAWVERNPEGGDGFWAVVALEEHGRVVARGAWWLDRADALWGMGTGQVIMPVVPSEASEVLARCEIAAARVKAAFEAAQA